MAYLTEFGGNQGFSTNFILTGGTLAATGGSYNFDSANGFGVTTLASSTPSLISEGIAIRSGTLPIHVAAGSAPGGVDLVVAGAIGGVANSVSKSGAGTLALAGANTSTGNTTVTEALRPPRGNEVSTPAATWHAPLDSERTRSGCGVPPQAVPACLRASGRRSRAPCGPGILARVPMLGECAELGAGFSHSTWSLRAGCPRHVTACLRPRRPCQANASAKLRPPPSMCCRACGGPG